MPRFDKRLNPLIELAQNLKRSRSLGTEESARLTKLIKALGHSLAVNDKRKATQAIIEIVRIFLHD